MNIDKMRSAGAKLANIAYNLAQRGDLPADIIASLDASRKEWDAATQAPSAPVAPDERAAFEAWAVTDEGGWTAAALKRNVEVREYENVGDYSDDDVHSQWEAWQARAALSVKAGAAAILEQAAQACDQQADGTNGPYRSGCLACANAVRELRNSAAAPTPPTTGEA